MSASILINNHNNKRWLRACLDSALNQTEPAEVIVYDDGSTDGSMSILHSYGSRIRLIAGERVCQRSGWANQGHGIHEAFSCSTGEQIHLLDGDDLYLPSRIEAYAKAWRSRPDAVMVQAPMKAIDEHGNRRGDVFEANRHGVDHLDAYYLLGDSDLFYPTSALAFSRDFLRRTLPLDFNDGLDGASDMRLSLIAPWAGPIICLDTPASIYRFHPNSMSAQNGNRCRYTRLRRRTLYLNHMADRLGKKRIPVWRNRLYRQACLHSDDSRSVVLVAKSDHHMTTDFIGGRRKVSSMTIFFCSIATKP